MAKKTYEVTLAGAVDGPVKVEVMATCPEEAKAQAEAGAFCLRAVKAEPTDQSGTKGDQDNGHHQT
jgi:hypothetical protein